MIDFADRWHLGLALVGLIVGSGIAALGRRASSTAVVPATVATVVMIAGSVRPDLWNAAVTATAVLGSLAIVLHRLASERRAEGPVASMVVGMAFVGLWATVPDTEAPLLLVAVTGPALLAAAITGTSLTAAERWISAAAFAGAAAIGAGGRTEALAGAACCGWMIVISPTRRPRPGHRSVVATMLAVQVISVLLGSRFVAKSAPTPAWSLALATVLVGGLALGTASGRWRQSGPGAANGSSVG